MASGSVKSTQLCKSATDFRFNASVAANTRTSINGSNAGYVIPDGYVGLVAGFTQETDLSATPTTLINFLNPRGVGTNGFVGIRSNAESTVYTRHISFKMMFIKSSFVDDRRT